MSNIIDFNSKFEEKLEKEFKKHLDIAETWLKTGDRAAYEDHMKIAESILVHLASRQELSESK